MAGYSLFMEKISGIFKKARKLQDIRQQEIIEKIKPEILTQAALSSFEANKSTISARKLKKIAQELNLNPEFVDDVSLNPFYNKNSVIKMFVKEEVFLEKLEPIHFVAGFNKRLSLIFLVAPYPELKKFKNLGLPLIYAIAFMDDMNNVFLVRRKKATEIINLAGDWPNSVVKILKDTEAYQSEITIAQKQIERPLFEKIRDWEAISKKEIASFFKAKDIKFTEVAMSKEKDENGKLVLDESEEKAVRFLRSLGMKAPTELDIIVLKALREAKMPHEHVLEFIKKSQL